MKKFFVNRSRESGFTLIELLVVVIIIAILAAIAVPVYIGIQNNAKKSAIDSDVATTKTNVGAVLAEDGTLPDGTYTSDPTAGSVDTAGDARIQNSHSPTDESVTVTVTTPTAGSGPSRQFTVIGSSPSIKYTETYTSDTGQTTSSSGSGGSAAAPAAPVYQAALNQSVDGWQAGPDTSLIPPSFGGMELQPTTPYANVNASAHRVVSGLNPGQTYTLTATMFNSYNTPNAQGVVGVTNLGDSAPTPIAANGTKTTSVSYTFVAPAGSVDIHVASAASSNIYDRDMIITGVSLQ